MLTTPPELDLTGYHGILIGRTMLCVGILTVAGICKLTERTPQRKTALHNDVCRSTCYQGRQGVWGTSVWYNLPKEIESYIMSLMLCQAP